MNYLCTIHSRSFRSHSRIRHSHSVRCPSVPHYLMCLAEQYCPAVYSSQQLESPIRIQSHLLPHLSAQSSSDLLHPPINILRPLCGNLTLLHCTFQMVRARQCYTNKHVDPETPAPQINCGVQVSCCITLHFPD